MCPACPVLPSPPGHPACPSPHCHPCPVPVIRGRHCQICPNLPAMPPSCLNLPVCPTRRIPRICRSLTWQSPSRPVCPNPPDYPSPPGGATFLPHPVCPSLPVCLPCLAATRRRRRIFRSARKALRRRRRLLKPDCNVLPTNAPPCCGNRGTPIFLPRYPCRNLPAMMPRGRLRYQACPSLPAVGCRTCQSPRAVVPPVLPTCLLPPVATFRPCPSLPAARLPVCRIRPRLRLLRATCPRCRRLQQVAPGGRLRPCPSLPAVAIFRRFQRRRASWRTKLDSRRWTTRKALVDYVTA